MTMRLDDPEVVRAQYASEQGLLARRSAYENAEGPDTREIVFAAVAEAAPGRILEVGCGPGELAERMRRELDVDVVAVDISPRMVELARRRGVDAHVGDVQALSFPDESFDCAVAAWVLFHPADLDRAVCELARVLRRGGRLVAATNGAGHLRELWDLVGVEIELPFRAENGGEVLAHHFDTVECRAVEGWIEFDDREAVRRYIASSIVHAARADDLPDLEGPLRARRRNAVFVAEKAP